MYARVLCRFPNSLDCTEVHFRRVVLRSVSLLLLSSVSTLSGSTPSKNLMSWENALRAKSCGMEGSMIESQSAKEWDSELVLIIKASWTVGTTISHISLNEIIHTVN